MKILSSQNFFCSGLVRGPFLGLLFFVVLLGACFNGCGSLPPKEKWPGKDKMADEPLPGAAVVHHATAAQIARGDAEAAGYLVTFRSDDLGMQNLQFASFGDEVRHLYSSLAQNFLGDPRVKDMRVITRIDLSVAGSTQWRAEFGLPEAIGYALGQKQLGTEPILGDIAKVMFRDQAAGEELLSEWEQDNRIWFAEPNYYSRLFDDPSPSPSPSPSVAPAGRGIFAEYAKTYSDLETKYSQVRLIKLQKAFQMLSERDQTKTPSDKAINASPPIVAVFDSGVDYAHKALKSVIWNNPFPGISGCDGDVHGCDTTKATKFSLGNGEVFPVSAKGPGQTCEVEKCDHGSHVAGIIASDPAQGGVGVCPVCQVMAVKVVEAKAGDDGKLEARVPDEAQVNGFKYIMRFTRNQSNAVRVINSSFGKYTRSRTIALLISVLRRAGDGVLVIGAAGNEDSMSRAYPAALSDVVAVAAVNEYGEKPSFSNFGPWVDIAAPGVNVSSTVPVDEIQVKQGTSMATPVVAGAAGLLLAANPGLSFTELRDSLIKSADAEIYSADYQGTPGGTAGFNHANYYIKVAGETVPVPLLGSGLLDVAAALQLKKGSPYITSTLDRVSPGCGIIGAEGAPKAAWLVFFLIFGCPLAIAIGYNRIKRSR